MKLFNKAELIKPDTFGCVMYDVHAQYDALASTENLTSSTEAIDLFKIWKNVTSSFGKLITSLKSNTFDAMNNIKSSELRKYIKGHKELVAFVENSTYDKLMDITIVAPTNINNNYYEVAKSIENFYDAVQLQYILDSCNKVFTSIYKDISNHNVDFKKFNSKLNGLNVDKSKKQIQKSLDAHVKLYSNKAKRDVTFKELFDNMKQFRDTKNTLLLNEKYILSIKSIELKMHNLHSLLEDMLEVAEKSEIDLDKKFIADTTKVIEFLARTADAYASVTRHLLVLEHNYCINLDSLNDALK